MSQSPQPYDPPEWPDSTPIVAEPQVDETIYRDGGMVVVPLAGWEQGTARFPRACIKCGKEDELQGRSEPILSQWRTPGYPTPVIQVRFCVCPKHARIANVWDGIGCAANIAWVVLLLSMLLSMHFDIKKVTYRGVVTWTIAWGLCFVFGMFQAGPWRGPLRLWKVRDSRAWISGTGGAFRKRFEKLPHSLRRSVFDLFSFRSDNRR